jgi:5-methyltetrahydropteroyltriglutamate--homocysteine methyltransferase
LSLPLLPVTTVGSWPRPAALLRARRTDPALAARLADAAVIDFLALQEKAGVDLVTDGELRRDNFYSFVADKLEGVQLMTLAEMLELIEDKAGFERILQTLDVPAYAISNPTCVGRLKRRQSLALDDVRFARRHTGRPLKVTLPGPYLLTRAMYVREASAAAYADKEALAEDVVRILVDEISELRAEGVDFLQLDEPVLTELVFAGGKTRTFMCAALARTQDPTAELELAVSLLARVLAAAGDMRTGLHVCRGNWSRDESTLLSGSYHPLVPWLARVPVDQLVLEYATERAGGLIDFPGKELGLGVVNPRTDRVETCEEIAAAVREALPHYGPERLYLNPDCGFATFANRAVGEAEIATRKLCAMVSAARTLREEL